MDETSDLALLGIYDAFLVAIPSLSLDSHRDVSVGEAIYAFGNPEGLSGTMSPGIVSAGLRKFKDGSSLLQITAPISSGSSGGPIVDAHAQVVGIAMGALKKGQNLNFAVPASSVRMFLNQWYKDNDPKISLWTGLVNLPGEEILDGEWVWLPDLGATQQWYATDARLACLSCKAWRWRRFVRAADAQRYSAS